MLLGVVASHPDSKTRDQLLHIMFNLIKRPDRHQRCAHCTYLATCIGTHCLHLLHYNLVLAFVPAPIGLLYSLCGPNFEKKFSTYFTDMYMKHLATG